MESACHAVTESNTWKKASFKKTISVIIYDVVQNLATIPIQFQLLLNVSLGSAKKKKKKAD